MSTSYTKDPGAFTVELQRHAVAAVLANMPAGVAVARSEGIDKHDFTDPALALIVAAAEFCATDADPQTATLKLAKRALVEFGLFKGSIDHLNRLSTRSIDLVERWTDESLVAFAHLYDGDPGAARVFCRWLRTVLDAIESEPVNQGISPVRLGLVLARLANFSGVPVDLLRAEYDRRRRRDLLIARSPRKGAAA